jgi:integrase
VVAYIALTVARRSGRRKTKRPSCDRRPGAARSDIARLGSAHIVNGEIVIARQKTKVTATIPLLPELKAVIEATPITGMTTFLITKTGKAFAPVKLSEQFRRWCDQAGLPPQYTLHGLRHAMGDTLATQGASPSEVAAVLGHSNVQTALYYMQEADRKRMARNAMARLKENG